MSRKIKLNPVGQKYPDSTKRSFFTIFCLDNGANRIHDLTKTLSCFLQRKNLCILVIFARSGLELLTLLSKFTFFKMIQRLLNIPFWTLPSYSQRSPSLATHPLTYTLLPIATDLPYQLAAISLLSRPPVSLHTGSTHISILSLNHSHPPYPAVSFLSHPFLLSPVSPY